MIYINCISYFLFSLLCNIFCKSMTFQKSPKVKRNPSIGIILLISILFSFLGLLNISDKFGNLVADAVSFVFVLIMQAILYSKRNRYKAVCFCVFFSSIVTVCKRLVDFTLGCICSLFSLTLSAFHEKILTLCFYNLIMILIVVIMHYSKENLVISKKIYLTALMLFSFSLFMLCQSVGGIFMFYARSVEDGYLLPDLFYLFMFVLLLVLFSSVSQFETWQSEHEKMKLVEQKNKMLEKSLEDNTRTFELWRKSIHDYKNNIYALTNLAKNGELAEINRYLEKENKLMDSRIFVIKTGSTCVDAIINTKLSIAEQKGIAFSATAVIPPECPISDFNFCSILGNLIDNAIEASEKEQEPYINVIITPAKQFMIIKVINKFTGRLTLKTHKNKPVFHGIGLKSVQGIVEDLNGSFSIEPKNGEVIANILIPLHLENN